MGRDEWAMGDLLPELPPEKWWIWGRGNLAVYEGVRKNMEKSVVFSLLFFYFIFLNLRS